MGFDKFSDIILAEVVPVSGLEYEIEGKLILNFEPDHKVVNLTDNLIVPGIKNNPFGPNLPLLGLPIPGPIPKIPGQHFASLHKIAPQVLSRPLITVFSPLDVLNQTEPNSIVLPKVLLLADVLYEVLFVVFYAVADVQDGVEQGLGLGLGLLGAVGEDVF
jgi:hypothetical protein